MKVMGKFSLQQQGNSINGMLREFGACVRVLCSLGNLSITSACISFFGEASQGG